MSSQIGRKTTLCIRLFKVRVLVTSRLEVYEVDRLQQGLFEEVLLPPLSEQDAIKLSRISSRPVSYI